MKKDILLNGDCLELMKDIPDGSIDAIICDLPYETLHKNNPLAAWDRMLPMEPLWEQYLRIAKFNAPIILFGQGMFSALLMTSQPTLWKYNLIWEKDRCTGFLNANRMPMRNHEDIIVFYREQPTYHPQMIYVPPKKKKTKEWQMPKRNRVGSTYDYAHIKFVKPTADPDYRFPRSVLTFKKEYDKQTAHPTKKPVDLLRYLIRTYTNPGDTVLDNCSGSGSTLVAAIREGRHYIGIEKDKRFYEQASAWIERETCQFELDFNNDSRTDIGEGHSSL